MKRILLITLSIVALVLELLPFGVVLNFGNPDGEPWRETYSYFSLTPFGYANFGPLIAAILTCVLIILSIIYLVRPEKGLGIAITNVAGFATAASLAPLLFGTSYFSAVGIAVSVLLAAVFGCSFVREKSKE